MTWKPKICFSQKFSKTFRKLSPKTDFRSFARKINFFFEKPWFSRISASSWDALLLRKSSVRAIFMLQLRAAISPWPVGLRIWSTHQNFGNLMNFLNLWKKLDFDHFSRPYDPQTPQNRFSALMSLFSIPLETAPNTNVLPEFYLPPSRNFFFVLKCSPGPSPSPPSVWTSFCRE